VLAGPLPPDVTITGFQIVPGGGTIVFEVDGRLWATTLHPDADGDGIPTLCDLCPGVADPAQRDADGDGVGEACDCDDTAPAVPGCRRGQ
jgi:hypothetical protein